MPTYTVHAPPPRRRSRKRSGALRVRARRIPFLGLPAGAVVAAVSPAVAGACALSRRSASCSASRLRLHRRAARRCNSSPVLLVALLVGFEAATLLALDAGAARLDDARLRGRRRRGKRRAALLRRLDEQTRADAAPPPPAAPEPHYVSAGAARAAAGPTSSGCSRSREAAMSVAIVDYGSGNLHSAAKAFERAARESGHDQPIVVTSDPDDDRARRPRGAAGRRRLRRLPARARRHSRHGRGAERKRA